MAIKNVSTNNKKINSNIFTNAIKINQNQENSEQSKNNNVPPVEPEIKQSNVISSVEETINSDVVAEVKAPIVEPQHIQSSNENQNINKNTIESTANIVEKSVEKISEPIKKEIKQIVKKPSANNSDRMEKLAWEAYCRLNNKKLPFKKMSAKEVAKTLDHYRLIKFGANYPMDLVLGELEKS